MSEIVGRLNRTIEARGADSLWVDSRDALMAAYQTISDLHERIGQVEKSALALDPVVVRREALEEANALIEQIKLHRKVIRGAESDMLNRRPDMDALEEIELSNRLIDEALDAYGVSPVGSEGKDQ